MPLETASFSKTSRLGSIPGWPRLDQCFEVTDGRSGATLKPPRGTSLLPLSSGTMVGQDGDVLVGPDHPDDLGSAAGPGKGEGEDTSSRPAAEDGGWARWPPPRPGSGRWRGVGWKWTPSTR